MAHTVTVLQLLPGPDVQGPDVPGPNEGDPPQPGPMVPGPPIQRQVAVGVPHVRKVEEAPIGHPLGALSLMHLMGEDAPLPLVERMGDVLRRVNA
jgi:hypothetical protein